jgi:hypothetical protein
MRRTFSVGFLLIKSKLRRRLERFFQIVSFSVTPASIVTANIMLVLHTMSKTEAHIETMRYKLNNDKNMKILDWLTPIDYSPQQTDYIRRRQPGAGQ